MCQEQGRFLSAGCNGSLIIMVGQHTSRSAPFAIILHTRLRCNCHTVKSLHLSCVLLQDPGILMLFTTFHNLLLLSTCTASVNVYPLLPSSICQAALHALQMELRYNEIDRARNIYERYVQCIPSVKAWVRYAKFEMKNGQVGLARQCYERAVGEMGEDAQTVSP